MDQLETAFYPRSIAVVGTSGDPLSFGHSFLLHLVNYGYQGKIYPVTPNWPEILGLKAYPALKDVPGPVDYVICCLPASKVPDLLRECPQRGVKVVHMFTGRFSETGRHEAAGLEQDILKLARELGLRLIGPNCMGVYHPGQRIAFGHEFPTEPGHLGMFLQSGGVAAEFIYYASLRGIRFSKVVSYGNALDINESDILEYLTADEETRLMAAYVEGIKDGRRFVRQLGRATASKPVIILKAGRGRAGADMAFSHTAALAGSDQVWDAAIRQAGAVLAETMEDMVDLAVSFYFLPPIRRARVGIIGGGGGKSVLSAGEWEVAGFEVAPLPPEIEALIRKRMPELWWGWIKNPVDLSIISFEARMADLTGNMLKMMARSDSYDLVVANLTVGGPLSKDQLALAVPKQVEEIIEAKRTGTNPVAVVLNTGTLSPREFDDQRWRCLAEAMPRLIEAGIPVYPSPGQAAGAIIRLIKYYRKRGAFC